MECPFEQMSIIRNGIGQKYYSTCTEVVPGTTFSSYESPKVYAYLQDGNR